MKKRRNRVWGTKNRPRVSIYKSNRYLYVQLIDDLQGKTMISISSLKFKEGKTCTNAKSVEIAEKIGKIIGKEAKERGIEQVVFDRGSYPYHGRVKALAEGMRKQGLKF
ncbi:50S ribosomal protein L18 [Candidatus Aerophobetes bacterium]|nr:50S ribosomal protein L18 [Candidatus Aerophobetes bacterium]